jgi:hypothetical protein
MLGPITPADLLCCAWLYIISCIGASVWRYGLGPVFGTGRKGQNPFSKMFLILNKNSMIDNIQKNNNCITLNYN